MVLLDCTKILQPEASEDIALWLADEFTQVCANNGLDFNFLAELTKQRQDNITVLLGLLDSSDFFSRLYSLQLISAISTARPQRTQECVYTAPLGVSRLVAILEDKREAIRTGMMEVHSHHYRLANRRRFRGPSSPYGTHSFITGASEACSLRECL